MSKLLADTDLSPEQQNYNYAIQSSGDDLFSFVEDMLDITRIETGHFELNPVPTNISRELEEICELLAPRAHQKNLEIAALADADLPELIEVDERRLRQVLINLIGNAIKFTSTGGISIVAQRVEDEVPSMEFIISDTGPGISDADKTRIFDEFEQADLDVTRKFGGAGLGLAISRAIIEKMNGRLTVHDNHPVGTQFIAQIPLFEASGQSVLGEAIGQQLTGTRVLIISRRNIEAEIIAQMIERAGGISNRVEEFSQIEPFLKQDDGCKIIIDEAMLEGDEALSVDIAAKYTTIKMLDPAKRHQIENQQEQGFSAYLIRPVRLESLLLVLSGKALWNSDEKLAKSKWEQGWRNHALLKKTENKTKKKTGSGRILLVEDNPVNSLLARSVLEKGGYQVDLAGDGAVGVEMMRAAVTGGEPFNLIYMDLHMPVMDGLSAIAKIRDYESQNHLPRVRIIALTADEQPQTRHEALGAGADGFLTKPLDPDVLLSDASINT